MPRLPRYTAPGHPQHVIQRGNNKNAVFIDAQDHDVYTEHLNAATKRHQCLIHAYVFMTNHVHLLVSPQSVGGIGRLMQSVGRRYVRYFNARHGRTGTLWEGRYRATLIDSEQYLLTCYRYIELNPVRAGLVRDPGDYRWSSYAANAFGTLDPLVSPHSLYLDLARGADARHNAYRALFATAIDCGTLTEIRRATNSEWALGNDDFRVEVGTGYNRRAGPLRRGRPLLRKPGIRV